MPTQGTATECLDDLLMQYDEEKIMAFVTKFTGVRKGAVESWRNGTLPRGEQMLRLQVMLDLVGYRVEEFSELPEPTKKFAQLIALDFVSIKGAQEILGYENTQSMYAFIRKGAGLMPDRMHRFMRFVEQSENELNGMLDEFRERFLRLTAIDDEAEVHPTAVEIRDKDVTNEPSIQLDEETLAHALVDTIKLMTSLARAIDSGSNAQMTRHNVLFVLKHETVDCAIEMLEKIRNP